MSSDQISVIAGIVLSLVFSYVPGLKAWFDTFNPEQKRVIMLALLAVVTAGAFALACSGLAADVGISVTCDKAGAVALAQAFVLAMIANQATYAISPKVAPKYG